MSVLRAFLVVIAFLSVSCGEEDTSQETFTVGIVNPVAMRDAVVETFRDGLTDLGYVEGENITYLYEGAIPNAGERAEWAQSLVEAGVDLLVGIATPGAISAAEATDTIPVLFFPVTDPVGSHLVESLREPGGNVTGVTNGNPHPIRLQLLLELDPAIEVVYAPYDADSPPAISVIPSLQETADELGVEIRLVPVRTEDEIRQSIQNMPTDADAIFNLPDPRVADYWREWSQAAVERRIPYSTLSRTEVEGGALMAYGEELDSVGEQAARMADRLLQGASPAEMPVETVNFFLSINMITAEQTGLTIPESVLNRATFTIYLGGDAG